MTEEKNKEVKKRPFGSFIGWVLSIFFGLGGLAFLSESIISGLSLILASLVLLPPMNILLKKKFNLTLSKKMKIIMIIILFLIYGFALPPSDSLSPEGANLTETKAQMTGTETKKTIIDNREVITRETIVPEEKSDYSLEMTSQQIFKEFEGLSELQIEEKIKEFKGKRIKTTLYVDKIDKASLSSQYVAMEMYEYLYNLLPVVKSFFPAGEKD